MRTGLYKIENGVEEWICECDSETFATNWGNGVSDPLWDIATICLGRKKARQSPPRLLILTFEDYEILAMHRDLAGYLKPLNCNAVPFLATERHLAVIFGLDEVRVIYNEEGGR